MEGNGSDNSSSSVELGGDRASASSVKLGAIAQPIDKAKTDYDLADGLRMGQSLAPIASAPSVTNPWEDHGRVYLQACRGLDEAQRQMDGCNKEDYLVRLEASMVYHSRLALAIQAQLELFELEAPNA